MSSPASRQRQRHRRRARERLWAVQKELAERQVDLVSYERVIADMTKQQLFAVHRITSIQLVTYCRDVTQNDCEKLLKAVDDQEQRVKDLEPKQEPKQETHA